MPWRIISAERCDSAKTLAALALHKSSSCTLKDCLTDILLKEQSHHHSYRPSINSQEYIKQAIKAFMRTHTKLHADMMRSPVNVRLASA